MKRRKQERGTEDNLGGRWSRWCFLEERRKRIVPVRTWSRKEEEKMKKSVAMRKMSTREEFRKVNYIKDVVDKSFIGLKEQGYIEAVKYLKKIKNMV